MTGRKWHKNGPQSQGHRLLFPCSLERSLTSDLHGKARHMPYVGTGAGAYGNEWNVCMYVLLNSLGSFVLPWKSVLCWTPAGAIDWLLCSPTAWAGGTPRYGASWFIYIIWARKVWLDINEWIDFLILGLSEMGVCRFDIAVQISTQRAFNHQFGIDCITIQILFDWLYNNSIRLGCFIWISG